MRIVSGGRAVSAQPRHHGVTAVAAMTGRAAASRGATVAWTGIVSTLKVSAKTQANMAATRRLALRTGPSSSDRPAAKASLRSSARRTIHCDSRRLDRLIVPPAGRRPDCAIGDREAQVTGCKEGRALGSLDDEGDRLQLHA